jgi:hypothetical protein
MDRPNEPTCGVALFAGADLRLVWCNPAYQSLLTEPYASDGAIGRPFAEFSLLAFTERAAAMNDVMETGVGQSGVDRFFSVEDGTRTFHWWMESPLPGHILLIVEEVSPTSAD